MTALTLRPIGEADLPFLRALYGSTREEELARVPWPREQREAFLDMQFEAQHRYYHEQFPSARFELVLADGEPVGRLYLDRRSAEHRLIDIALVPERRGRGLGRRLMRRILAEAEVEQRKVRIHVEKSNPAMRLYRRLGFSKVDDQGVYDLLEWRPPATVAVGESP